MALTAGDVKKFAKNTGADLVGIGDLNRFDGAPPRHDARYINPDANRIIAFAFRIPRGDLRGIEEGSHFYQYPAMSYANINEVYAPTVLRETACFIEDHGYEASSIRNYGCINMVSDVTGDPEEPAEYGRRVPYSRPVRDGQPPPDIFIHFRIAAFICGLGEIGYGKIFLTPQFGPRQRLAFMITDADLQPDPIYDGPPLCDRCMTCVNECPVGAISPDEQIEVTIAGHDLSWGKLDPWHCFAGYASCVREVNPFLPPDAFEDMPDAEQIRNGEATLEPEQVLEIHRRLARYYPQPSGYFPAMCGGRGCLRGCMVHLEQRDVLKNKFKNRFRRRPKWWS